MKEFVTTLLASIGASSAIAAILQTVLTEKVRQAIAADYAAKLATLQSQLDANNKSLLAVQATANLALTDSHKATHERRLEAIDALWSAFLFLRDKTPGFVFMYCEVYAATEYAEFFTKPELVHELEEYDMHTYIQDVMKPTMDVENHRPYVGDNLFLLFFVYRAVMARLTYVVSEAGKKGAVADWRTDAGIRQLLSEVLPTETVNRLMSLEISAWSAIRLNLETQALKEINDILTGKKAAEFHLEQASRIAEIAESMGKKKR